MQPRRIEMATYPRKKHFDYFRAMAYPYVGATVKADITDFTKAVKREGLPFFLSFCYCAARAANDVPEFRQRIEGDGIAEFAHCPTSHTVALEDSTYCYCTLRSDMPFEEYLPRAVQAQQAAQQARCVEDGEEEAGSLIFISTLPWFSYESLIQPVPAPADSNPRITWGRYTREDGRVRMPVTALCHHALVDGLHLARFYEALEAHCRGLL